MVDGTVGTSENCRPCKESKESPVKYAESQKERCNRGQ